MDNYVVYPLAQGVYLLYEKAEAVSMYLVCGRQRAALIDTGCGTGDLPAAVAQLTGLPVTVLLTHGHSDHYCGAFFYPQAYLDPRDMPLANAWPQEFAQMEREAGQDRRTLAALARLRRAGPPQWLPCPAELSLGGRTLQTVDLRGHTQGSVGFLLAEDRLLFSGDGLTFNVWMQLNESATLQEYHDTLLRLKPLQSRFDRICNGHGILPDSPQHLDNVLRMVEGVLQGQPGQFRPQEYVPGWFVQGQGCQMLYDQQKIYGRTDGSGTLLPPAAPTGEKP